MAKINVKQRLSAERKAEVVPILTLKEFAKEFGYDIKSEGIDDMYQKYLKEKKGEKVDANKKYILERYSGDVVEDDFEEGESTESHHSFDVKVGESYGSKEELIKAMNDIMNVKYKEGEFDWESGDGENIQTDVLVSFDQQGDFFPATEDEKKLWKKKKKKLYNAHYWFYVTPIFQADEYAKGGKKLSEKEFWEIIEGANWKKDHSYKRIQKEFGLLPNDKFKQVEALYRKKHRELQDKTGLMGMDRWDDVTAETIGRGKKFYDSATREKLERMEADNDYTESFSYSFHIGDILSREGGMYDKGGLTDDAYYNSVNHFVFFSLNYPVGFLDAWSGGTKEHMEDKFRNAYEKAGTYGAMIKFWTELDSGNRRIFAKWIKENYKGVPLMESGGKNRIEAVRKARQDAHDRFYNKEVEGEGYSYDNYKEGEWKKIFNFLLEEGFSLEGAKQILASKHTRWAADNAGKDENVTFKDWMNYYNKVGKKELADMLKDDLGIETMARGGMLLSNVPFTDSMQLAYNVLREVDKMMSKEFSKEELKYIKENELVYVKAYSNGREQGYHLTAYPLAASFAESRGSDNLVIYEGRANLDFQMSGNIPTEKIYQNSIDIKGDDKIEKGAKQLMKLIKEGVKQYRKEQKGMVTIKEMDKGGMTVHKTVGDIEWYKVSDTHYEGFNKETESWDYMLDKDVPSGLWILRGQGKDATGRDEEVLMDSVALETEARVSEYAKGGKLKGVFVFDNDGKTADRYTIITKDGDVYGASTNPFSPTGIGQSSGNVTDRMNKTFGYGWRKGRNEKDLKRILKSELNNYLNQARGNSEWLGKEVKDLNTLPDGVKKYIEQITTEQEVEMAKGGQVTIGRRKFNSHKVHNPYTDILEGHIDNDSFITYAIDVKGDTIGKESMELYVGENYVVDSKKKSYSRHYEVKDIPHKYLEAWYQLRREYQEQYKDKAEHGIKTAGFDINRSDLYEHDKPELKERTKQRLSQISELGMEEVGLGEFGVKGVMSGLYIEKVWSYSDEDFNGYMEWAKSVIEGKSMAKGGKVYDIKKAKVGDSVKESSTAFHGNKGKVGKVVSVGASGFSVNVKFPGSKEEYEYQDDELISAKETGGTMAKRVY